MHAYAGRQFVPFLWWSLVWPGREANSRTVREADTLPTEPTRHGFDLCQVLMRYHYRYIYTIMLPLVYGFWLYASIHIYFLLFYFNYSNGSTASNWLFIEYTCVYSGKCVSDSLFGNMAGCPQDSSYKILLKLLSFRRLPFWYQIWAFWNRVIEGRAEIQPHPSCSMYWITSVNVLS